MRTAIPEILFETKQDTSLMRTTALTIVVSSIMREIKRYVSEEWNNELDFVSKNSICKALEYGEENSYFPNWIEVTANVLDEDDDDFLAVYVAIDRDYQELFDMSEVVLYFHRPCDSKGNYLEKTSLELYNMDIRDAENFTSLSLKVNDVPFLMESTTAISINNYNLYVS